MPRPLRLTMFFDDGISGWSESHLDVNSATLQQAVQKALGTLVIARIQLMANGPWLKYLRASFDDTFRDSQVFYLPVPDRSNTGTVINNPLWKNTESGEPWTVALLRGVGGDLYRKQIYVSGVPYTDTPDTGDPFADPILVAAYNNYRNTLVTSYGFPIWRKDIQTYPLRPITAIVPGVLPGTWNLTVPNHGVASPVPPGTRGFLMKMRYLFSSRLKLNGPYGIASVIDPNTIQLGNFPWQPGAVFTGGLFQQQTKDVQPYTEILLERFTHRKRGRPFDSPRGRSRRGTISRAY